MDRHLSPFLLSGLQKRFAFLKDWQPEIHTPDRPVTFEVRRELSADTVFSLEYGRYNNSVDKSYTNGVTDVGLVGADGKLKWISLDEGDTKLKDILEPDTEFLLVVDDYVSRLVYDDAGCVKYVLYKNVQTAVQEVTVDGERAADRMAAELSNVVPLTMFDNILQQLWSSACTGKAAMDRREFPYNPELKEVYGALQVLMGATKEGGVIHITFKNGIPVD